jgi:hypothetical protein
MTRRDPLKSPALWVVVGVLATSAATFGVALNALGITLRKLKIEADHGIVTSDISGKTASWERLRDQTGAEIPDRREIPEVEKELGTTNYVSRAYVERRPKVAGRPNVVQLHLAYYTGMIDPVPHVPDRCFVGGGMQIGSIVGDVPLKLDKSLWRLDESVPEGQRPLYRVFLAGEPPFGGEYVRLCRSPEEIRLRTMVFVNEGVNLYAGYFFIANGGHTPSPAGVRGLAYELTSKHAYYMKVQVTSSTTKTSEEFVAAASSLIGELLGDIMRVTPDWVSVLEQERLEQE